MPYTLKNARDDTRRYLKDTTESVWTNADINAFINEGIRIIKATIPEYFTDLEEIDLSVNDADNVEIIMDDDGGIGLNYTNLIPIFASARCFEQDEQHYRATQKMNEFESRKLDMEYKVTASKDYSDKISETGGDTGIDYIVDKYFDNDDSEDYIAPLNPER
jgi:hypothetical protein